MSPNIAKPALTSVLHTGWKKSYFVTQSQEPQGYKWHISNQGGRKGIYSALNERINLQLFGQFGFHRQLS